MRPNQTNYYAPGGGLGVGALNRAVDGIGQASEPIIVIREPSPFAYAWSGLSLISGSISAYHGFRRNRGSVPWAIGWGLLGGAFPVIVPVLAYLQGFAKPAVTANSRRRRRTSRRRR